MKKKEIRKYYLDKRKALSKKEVENKSHSIADNFFYSIDLVNIKVVHVFIPITKFNEVNTWLIINKIWTDYTGIKIATSITESDKLVHVLIDNKTVFIDDKWGIPTPQNCKKIDVKDIDLVVTPLLAFDSDNNRVGYGKGYYDKFFSDCNSDVKKIGVSLFPVLEDKIEDTNSFDIPLNSIITF